MLGQGALSGILLDLGQPADRYPPVSGPGSFLASLVRTNSPEEVLAPWVRMAGRGQCGR